MTVRLPRDPSNALLFYTAQEGLMLRAYGSVRLRLIRRLLPAFASVPIFSLAADIRKIGGISLDSTPVLTNTE